VILGGRLRAQGADGGGFLLVVVGVVDEVEAGSGQDVEAEVAATFSPFVVLLGQDGPVDFELQYSRQIADLQKAA
jgi:hypothetical protein